MQYLPRALAGLSHYRQFIVCRLSPDPKRPGKTLKHPLDPRTLQIPPKGSGGHLNPETWLSFDEASALVQQAGQGHMVGFVFVEHDPFWFLDIDNCISTEGHLSHLAQSLIAFLPGAAVELSQSGRGLHLFGTGHCPEHGCKNTQLGIEFYTQNRFVVLTGADTQGNVATDCSQVLPQLVETFFPMSTGIDDGEWSHEPVEEWHGPDDDDLLLEKAMGSMSAGAAFGAKASFKDLFYANEDVLANVFPDSGGSGRPYDASSADAALAQHLAFWTGKDHDRIHRLMWRSKLVREKWQDRADYYLPKTIRKAVARQSQVYNALRIGPAPAAAPPGPVAENSLPNSPPPGESVSRVEVTDGLQYMDPQRQIEYFAGCVYVRNAHRVFVPDGAFLKPEQFKAAYGGYMFSLDTAGAKTSKNAWEVFTESQALRFPKVHHHTFRPNLAPGAIITEEGRLLVNTYVPIETRRVQGDPTPFLNHLARMLPDQRDQAILLNYMAAVVQYPGEKFRYCPVLQGAEGNGKTTVVDILAFAVGHRYSHMPNASELAKSGGKFTGWMDRKLFIGAEDIHIENRAGGLLDLLKPMISNRRLEMQKKGLDQEMGDNVANWLMCCNRKEDVPSTVDGRRYPVFFTAQQTAADIEAHGMGGSYFRQLVAWLRADGYAIMNNYLREFRIADEFNPAILSRAPRTSSTAEANELSRDEVEQQVLEAVETELPGFRGGWISSIALDNFLEARKLTKGLPPNKRRDLLKSLGYDWHPHLHHTRGRVNNVIMAEGGKPRLFLRIGHPAGNFSSPPEIVAAYEKAQGYGASSPETAFSREGTTV